MYLKCFLESKPDERKFPKYTTTLCKEVHELVRRPPQEALTPALSRRPPPSPRLAPTNLRGFSPLREQCQRELPEFRGYAAPSIGVILGVFLVGSTALFCGIAGISIAREYSKESAAARRRDALRAATAGRGLRAAEPSGGGNEDGYLTLAGDTDDEESDDLMGGSINTSTEEEGRAVPKGKRDYGRGGPTRMGRASGSSARRRRRRRAAAAAAAAQLGPSPLARKVSFYTRLLCGTGLAATLIMCGVVVAFAPHAPGVNVCNTEFDWVSDGGRRRGVVAVRF